MIYQRNLILYIFEEPTFRKNAIRINIYSKNCSFEKMFFRTAFGKLFRYHKNIIYFAVFKNKFKLFIKVIRLIYFTNFCNLKTVWIYNICASFYNFSSKRNEKLNNAITLARKIIFLLLLWTIYQMYFYILKKVKFVYLSWVVYERKIVLLWETS